MNKAIIEEGILFVDKKIFGDEDEHEYKCKCMDGIAYGTKSDEEDINSPLSIIIEYPTLSELSNKEKDHILEYRGLYDLNHNDITYGDVMVALGKIKF